LEILLGLVVLVALWLFIRHDQARLKSSSPEPISREKMQKGFKPGTSAAWKAQAGVALMALIGSAQQFLSPSLPPFTGRWSFFLAVLHNAMGTYGLAIFWCASAITFAATAYRKYKAIQK
jgi:hypothetical protein